MTLSLSILLLAETFVAAPRAVSGATPDGNAAIADALLSRDAIVCASGFEDTRTREDMALHGVTLTNGGALAVGFAGRRQTNDFGRRRPVAMQNVTGRWTKTFTTSPGQEDGLVAVTAGPSDDAWAVGFTTIKGQVMPLAMHWDGEAWAVRRPARQGKLTSLFTGVAMVGDKASPLAVGYRMTATGKQLPIAALKSGRHWRYVDPSTRAGESVSLTGVSPDGLGGAWAVGHGGRGAQIGPVIYQRVGARWKRTQVPDIKGEGVLADVVAIGPEDAWAVGYQRVGDRSVPLVMHYEGSQWQHAVAPAFDSGDVVLTAVSAAPEGGVWVVGAAWNADLGDHEAVAAWWDGQAWNEVSGVAGGNELLGVTGSLDADGWAVGRAGHEASATRVCTPSPTGIFGGSEPSQQIDALEPGVVPRANIAAAAEPNAEQAATVGEPTETASGSGSFAATKKAGNSKRSKLKSTSQRRYAVGPLPRARADSKLVARNVASQANVAMTMSTYGAEVADFDGDGVDDLYIGRHGGQARLALNRDGTFVTHQEMHFPTRDRHGCSAADIDGSGLPDLYCAIGGQRGSGLKSNELWIDPGGPAPYDAASADGISDPTGRGRDVEFLEVRRSSKASLVVTNSPTRVDGLPSPSRLFVAAGDGTFAVRPRTGFAAGLGSLATQDADFDRDGREDLLLVTGGQQAPKQRGARLYHNTPAGLVDVTKNMGISSFGEVDAELVDLNGDKKLDLVQLSPTRLRVSILSRGRFVRVYERSLTHGRAVAGGDVNGDGRGDLYIVRGNGNRNPADVMLVNRKGGRAFSSMVIPQIYTGDGQDAVAIDHDGNGKDDFLVLNGRNKRGPIELIAFYKR